MERNRYAVRVVSQQGDVETGIGDENKNALEIYIYIHISVFRGRKFVFVFRG